MTTPRAIVERMWSRKFLLVSASQFSNVLLFAFGVLSEDGFVALTMALLGGFVAGNVAQHIWEPPKGDR